MREYHFWLGLTIGWIGGLACGLVGHELSRLEGRARGQEVQVRRAEVPPEPRPLQECQPGDKVDLATNEVWIVLAPAGSPEPYQVGSDGVPVRNAGSLPPGWPNATPAPEGWVLCGNLSTGRCHPLPGSWMAWPVKSVTVQAWRW